MKIYIMSIIMYIPEGAEIFLLSKTSGVGLGPTQPSN